MKKDRFVLSLSFLTVALTAIGHHWAAKYKLYFSLPGLDLVIHFLLSFGLLLLLLYFFRSFLISREIFLNKSYILLGVVCASFVIGVSWELFEFWAEILLDSYYWSSTALDVLMDVAGGLTAYFVFHQTGLFAYLKDPNNIK